MRIIMPTFERIEWMPPTIDLLKRLDKMGHEIVCITIYPSIYLEKMNLKNVKNIYLYKNEICLTNKIKYKKGISGVLFRIDNLIKHILSMKLTKLITAELEKGGYLWVVNEMTVLLAGSKFLNDVEYYAFTIYELHEDTFANRHIKRAAQNADIVVVPEYCRAHIMKSRYHLKKLPIVLPNKSEIEPCVENLPKDALNAIEIIKAQKAAGKRVILYMGGIGPERPLEKIILALNNSEKYILAIMGRKTEYLKRLQQMGNNNFVYLGAYKPPIHLEIAKYADIGVLNYVSLNREQGLNAIFCAPNKIYEYTGMGLPVIANDIPGLRFEILSSKCGELVEFDQKESILLALDKISNKYEMYSEAAKKYYEKMDISSIICGVIAEFENR